MVQERVIVDNVFQATITQRYSAMHLACNDKIHNQSDEFKMIWHSHEWHKQALSLSCEPIVRYQERAKKINYEQHALKLHDPWTLVPCVSRIIPSSNLHDSEVIDCLSGVFVCATRKSRSETRISREQYASMWQTTAWKGVFSRISSLMSPWQWHEWIV